MANQIEKGNRQLENDQLAPQRGKHLTRRQRKVLWKAARRRERNALKERLRYAPFLHRLWVLYLWKPVAALLTIVILASVLYRPAIALLSNVVMNYYYTTKDKPLSEKDLPKIYEHSPMDEKGAERISSYPAIGQDETWTICVYMVGSNLEDMGENDLSQVTSLLTRKAAQESRADSILKRLDHLTRFNSELKAEGLDLPEFYFYPDKPVASSTVVTEDVVVAERPGAASTDIREMTAGKWSDNISVVIQTGGATRWSNQLVNPNRTQRFLYKSGVFKEVADLQLEPPSEPETLSSFLRFCKDEYPADHTMLVLWNHGGGPFGYGMDSIYDGEFSLKDIRAALSDVYTPDRDKPAFDIIGFDACLMSSIEVTHALDGFAKFYCLSEEVEPGDGWDYTPLLQAMTDDPAMSPARVAQTVADSFTDFYMRENINQQLVTWDVAFSVVDAAKAEELYDAYCALCKAQLSDAVDDLGVLAEIGRCAGRATRYCGADFNVFNLVDLGNYMDYLGDSYPEECRRVKDLVGEAVLYHRQSGGLSDSTGISVYVPADVTTAPGLIYYLDYIYDISEDDSITALYYYKQAGCLTDDLKKAADLKDNKKPRVLDLTAFRQFTSSEPSIDEIGFMIPVSGQLQDLIVDYQLETAKYDEENAVITYYGREDCLILDGEGHLVSDFDGRWICLDGQPLSLEVVSTAPAATEYRSHVKYNGNEAYLQLSRDPDTDEIHITGVRKVPDGGIEDDANYLNNTRSNEEVELGASITPIYLEEDFKTGSTSSVEGRKIKLSKNSSVRLESLPSGQYLNAAVITDPRGDSYYSAVISSEMKGGTMAQWQVDARFVGNNYH